MTNYPVSHARNARQFVEFAKATAGSRISLLPGVLKLFRMFGLAETIRMFRNVSKGRSHHPDSVLTETYWSRGALSWGPTLAVRYLLRPASGTRRTTGSRTDPEYLSTEASRRISDGDVHIELCIQRFRDEASTPIEDACVEWTESASPPEPVAVLTVPRGDVTTPEAQTTSRAIDALAFNPWNTTDDFRPLGNLNRARKAAYDASAAVRGGVRWRTEVPRRNEVLGAGARAAFSVVNRVVPWHRLPVRTSVLNLEAFRHVLRKQNLIDTEQREAPPRARAVPSPPSEESRVARTFDGRDNDLSAPDMGAVGAAFGRNLAPDYRPNSFNHPNPVTVSRTSSCSRALPAGPVAEPARGSVDPVPGARLGQPRAASSRGRGREGPDARRPEVAEHPRRRAERT